MAVSKHWCPVEIDTIKHEDLNLMFANHGEKDAIDPLATIERVTAQKKDQELKIYYK